LDLAGQLRPGTHEAVPQEKFPVGEFAPRLRRLNVVPSRAILSPFAQSFFSLPIIEIAPVQI
jgi:hypothetical protein